MPILQDCNGDDLTPGSVVWAEGVVGFPDEVMLAHVLDQPTGEGAVAIEFARHGWVPCSECVYLRQLPTAAVPIPAGTDPWVTRWPAAKTMTTHTRIARGAPSLL
jgi:hypothetical protein